MRVLSEIGPRWAHVKSSSQYEPLVQKQNRQKVGQNKDSIEKERIIQK